MKMTLIYVIAFVVWFVYFQYLDIFGQAIQGLGYTEFLGSVF